MIIENIHSEIQIFTEQINIYCSDTFHRITGKVSQNTYASLRRFCSSILFIVCFMNQVFPQDAYINKSNNDTIDNKKLTYGIVIGSTTYMAGMAHLCVSYYNDPDHFVKFHFLNDLQGNLQIDKFQHAFGSYWESYLCYKWLINSGVTKKKALLYGGTIGFVLQSPKELIDGFYKPTGFSWWDLAANAFGSVLFIGQELLFDDQILKYKFSISKTEYATMANGYFGRTWLKSLFNDFNGQTAWFSLNVNKLFLNSEIPDWVNIAFGYSANGMIGVFENIESFRGVPIPEIRRYRQLLLSLDVDWLKIKTDSKFLKVLFKGLAVVKLPFPAIEFNTEGKFKGYWIYF